MMSLGDAHTVALLSHDGVDGGRLIGWGRETSFGAVGYGDTTNDRGDDELPSSYGLLSFPHLVKSVCASRYGTAVLTAGGDVYAWCVRRWGV